jgi:hypothetical protein
MSNTLSVRRVRFQEIDEQGRDVGKPTFGVLASDDYESNYVDIYASHQELEQAIDARGNILDIVPGFSEVSGEKIGKLNYFGPVTSYADDDDDGQVD